MAQDKLKNIIKNQNEISALRDRITDYEDVIDNILTKRYFEQNYDDTNLVRLKDPLGKDAQNIEEVEHMDEVIKIFEGRLDRMMKAVKSIQIDMGDWQHLMLKQKKSIKSIQNRVGQLEEVNVDIDDIIEDGENLSAKDIVKFMQKV